MAISNSYNKLPEGSSTPRSKKRPLHRILILIHGKLLPRIPRGFATGLWCSTITSPTNVEMTSSRSAEKNAAVSVVVLGEKKTNTRCRYQKAKGVLNVEDEHEMGMNYEF